MTSEEMEVKTFAEWRKQTLVFLAAKIAATPMGGDAALSGVLDACLITAVSGFITLRDTNLREVSGAEVQSLVDHTLNVWNQWRTNRDQCN